ncbi:MAG: (Na+)-NQR maturation NqrM [Pirellulales bacterium]|nr:(Na+)-NQR maturation NqrM [Pirellulales bacterium]
MIWQTFLIASLVFLAVVTGMAVGVILGNRRIKGSCGGLANLRDEHGNTICEACTNPSPNCAGEPEEKSSAT